MLEIPMFEFWTIWLIFRGWRISLTKNYIRRQIANKRENHLAC